MFVAATYLGPKKSSHLLYKFAIYIGPFLCMCNANFWRSISNTPKISRGKDWDRCAVYMPNYGNIDVMLWNLFQVNR